MAKVDIKKPIVDEIKAALDGAQTAVLVDYRGLTVAQDTELRRQMRAAGVSYKIYKNTYINFAIKGSEFAELAPHLEGPTALATCKEDPIAAARILAKFAETNEALTIKGGYVDGTFYDEKTIVQVAKIPSRDELVARLLGSMKSPISNFARVIKQIAEKNGEVVA